MPDYSGLVKAMKQAGVEATNAGGPVTVCFGKVMNTAPLQILVDQKMTLGAAQLVLTRNVTDYETEVTVEWETETSDEHNHILIGKKKITIHNALMVGDDVVLIRQQGGQKYIVVDRIGET